MLDTGIGKEEYIPHLEEALLDPTKDYDPNEPRVSDIILSHKHQDHINGLPSVLALLRRLWDTQTPAPTTPFKPPRIHKIPLPVPDAHLTSIIDSLKPGSFTPSPTGATVHDLFDDASLPVTCPSFPADKAQLRILHTPGHTADSLCIHYPLERAFFTADTVLGHGSSVFEDLGPYMSSLQKMIAYGETTDADGERRYGTVYPGHGPVVSDGLGKVKTYLKHRIEREDQIVRALQEPLPEDTAGSYEHGWTTESLVASIYAKYPKELWAAAARGVEMHLTKLLAEGRIVKDGSVWVLIH